MSAELEVKILDKSFRVNCNEEEYAALKSAVEYVNEHAHKIATAANTVNIERIAVMVALNLAYELLSIKLPGGFDIDSFQGKINTMTNKLDAVLKRQEDLF